MVKTNHITAFVNDLLNFKADLVLQAMKSEKIPAVVAKMAADSPHAMILSTTRVGSLTDPENRMLVRVFKDEGDQCFRLYLLSSRNQSTAYSLLTIPDNSNYFVVDANGQVEIPYSTEINPLNVVFNLNYPLQILELNTFTHENRSLIHEYFKFHMENDESPLSIEILSSNSSGDRAPSKLFFRSEQESQPFIRLIPCRDRRAAIHFDGSIDLTKAVTVCTFA